jgi:nuclear-control-of-ATPase protein 2
MDRNHLGKSTGTDAVVVEKREAANAEPPMSRLRITSANFAENFARPLSGLPTGSSTASDGPPVVSESTEALRSLLGSLKPPVSQSSVDEALKYLAREDRNALVITEDAPEQEKALKDAVVGQVAVGLYARSLDIYLNEAMDIEAEAEWWANVGRSSISVAWFLLQSTRSFSLFGRR